MLKLLSALQQRPFRLLWSGQTISRLGDSLYQIALAWWVLEKTGSGVAMGTVLTFSFLPMVLFLPIGGVAVDRWSRFRVMLVTDVVRGILVAAVAVLTLTRAMQIWHVYAVSVVFGLVNAFFQPAYTAAVPEITPREALPSANALTDLSWQLTGIAGPAAGALIVGIGGTPLAFSLDAVSFLISAAFVLSLLRSAARQAPARGPIAVSAWSSAREGIKIVLGRTWLCITIVILSLINLTGRSPMNVALPFLVQGHLGASVETLGLMYSLFAVGSVLGAAWAGRSATRRRRCVRVYAGLTLVGLLTLAIGLLTTALGVGIVVLLLGGVLAVTNLTWTHVLQEYIPQEALGRVGSINALGSNALLPIGFGLAGWATDSLGAPPVFIAGGLLTLGLAITGLLQPAVRRLD